MKGVAILAVILSGFYIGTTKVIMFQLKDLENFYANADQAAAAVAEGKDVGSYILPLQRLKDSSSTTVGL